VGSTGHYQDNTDWCVSRFIGQRGDMHHGDGGPDPTELALIVQQVLHRPTGACHTSRNYPSQPDMGALFALSDEASEWAVGVFKI